MKTKKSTLALVLVMALSTACLPSMAQANNTAGENAAAGALAMIVLCMFFCGSDNNQNDSSYQQNDDNHYYELTELQTPSYHSTPVKPIGPLYEVCHSPMGC